PHPSRSCIHPEQFRGASVSFSSVTVHHQLTVASWEDWGPQWGETSRTMLLARAATRGMDRIRPVGHRGQRRRREKDEDEEGEDGFEIIYAVCREGARPCRHRDAGSPGRVCKAR